jgi:hypothetical protein
MQTTGNPEQFLAKRNTDDLWGFRSRDAKNPSQGITITHYRGYDILRQHQRSETYANKLWQDILAAGFEYVDGINLKLVDEDQ